MAGLFRGDHEGSDIERQTFSGISSGESRSMEGLGRNVRLSCHSVKKKMQAMGGENVP